MSEICAGRVEALVELYDRYCDRAYRVAISVCGDENRAQAAVREVFLSVWRSRASYRPQSGSVAAWLLSSVRYQTIDLEAVHRDQSDPLVASLAVLPDAQQEVIALAYYGELSHTEIAAQLKLPIGTVKGRMRLGLQKLRSSDERQVA